MGRIPVRVVGAVLLSWCIWVPRAGAQPAPLPITVTHSGHDDLGVSLVNKVKEALRQSARYAVAETEKDAELTLHISTINPHPTKPGVQSVVGWSLVVPKRNDTYLSGGVQSFGADQVTTAANSLAAAVDTLASRHHEEIPGSSEAKEAERSWDAAVERAAQKIRLEARQKLFVQHMELQRKVFQLSGFRLPADASELAADIAAEYDESDTRLAAEELSACRLELAALKKAVPGATIKK